MKIWYGSHLYREYWRNVVNGYLNLAMNYRTRNFIILLDSFALIDQILNTSLAVVITNPCRESPLMWRHTMMISWHENPFRIRDWFRWSIYVWTIAKQWRHNGHNCVSNYQPHDCLLNRLFRRRSKETSKLRVTGLCVGNSPGTGEFPAQMASYAENVSIMMTSSLEIMFPLRLLQLRFNCIDGCMTLCYGFIFYNHIL